LENDVVFLRGWPGFFKSDETIRKYYKKFKFFERAPLPFFNGNKTNAVFGGWNLMISKFSNNKEAALEFLKFAASKEIQKMLHVESGYFPVHKEVYSDQEFINQNPAVTDIKYFLDSGKHRPYMENYSHISDIMAYFFKRALMKKISVEEALIGASDEINVKQVF
jgi:ABC-type glycerol-3-phosphate transport system substrate-binding protein